MSYDIDLVPQKQICEHCNREFDTVCGPDPTYNLSQIFDFALTGETFPSPETTEAHVVLFRKETSRPRGLRILNDRLAKDTIAEINQAIDRMFDNNLRTQFKSLEPDNGWGTLPDAISVMKTLRRLAEENPNHSWNIR